MKTRKSTVMGQFYPSSAKEINDMLVHYNKILEKNVEDENILELKPRAVIVPHAGYIYSAFTANIAYRLFKNTKAKRVVVIGPSHRVHLKGTSVSDFDQYETPFGALQIDHTLVGELKEKFDLHFVSDAHHEHSTEVQMPFIKSYDTNALVVELVYGDADPQNIAKIIEYLLKDPDTFVVISTDLSHYYDIDKAKKLDNICLNAVINLNTKILHQGCEACGKIGIEAMLITAKKNGLEPILLDYRTSADASGEKSNVVGYMSAAFIRQ
ncbi:MAG: AmmeMemoRadiSam system protein B [Campylobacteraceae bacterium]|nr:AmmeMemoRadiSam system protein B [Campylobacteraceae bacterium]